jgi:hypothetical protein
MIKTQYFIESFKAKKSSFLGALNNGGKDSYEFKLKKKYFFRFLGKPYLVDLGQVVTKQIGLPKGFNQKELTKGREFVMPRS